MNWPQLLKPRACRSALCLRTADSNSKRGINCRICEKILLTRVKAQPPYRCNWLLQSPTSSYQMLGLFYFTKPNPILDKRDMLSSRNPGEGKPSRNARKHFAR